MLTKKEFRKHKPTPKQKLVGINYDVALVPKRDTHSLRLSNLNGYLHSHGTCYLNQEIQTRIVSSALHSGDIRLLSTAKLCKALLCKIGTHPRRSKLRSNQRTCLNHLIRYNTVNISFFHHTPFAQTTILQPPLHRYELHTTCRVSYMITIVNKKIQIC